MRPKRWGGPPGPRGSAWTRSALEESRGGPAPMWRAPHTLRRAACALLAIALGAGLEGVAAAATATTATKTSTTKSTAAAHTAAKATGAKPTTTGGPAAHKVPTATGTTAARTAQSKAAAHPASSQAAKSATAKGTGPKTTRKSGSALAKNRKSPKSAPRQRVQAVPTPDRYKEIQQALADRGFYKGEVNGTWGSDSVGALKAFQVSLKLTDDGKINALSLIGLGLGAQHTYVPAAAPPVSGSPPTSAGQTSGGVTGDSTGPGPVAPQTPPGAANGGGTTNPQQPASPATAPGAPATAPVPAAPQQPHVPDGLSPPGVSQ
jgi:Putative peptidoglycan binding domain